MPILAIGAVELVALLVALAVLLLLIAFRPVAQVLERAFSQIPVIGRYIGGALVAAISAAIQGIEKVLDDAATGMAHLVWMLAVGVWHLLYQIIATVSDAKLWAVRAAQAAANNLVTAERYAQGLVGGILGTVQQWIWNTMGFAQGLVNGALATAQQWVWAAMSYAAGLVSGALSTVQQWVWGVEATVANDIAGVEAQIQAVASDVISEANTVLGEAETAAAGLVAGVEAEVQALGGVIQGLQGEVGNITGLLPLLGALPLLNSAVQALTTEADQCLKPLCDTVTPNAKWLQNLANIFGSLESDALLAALLLFIAEMATNPAGAVQEAESVLGGAVSASATAFRDLIGV